MTMEYVPMMDEEEANYDVEERDKFKSERSYRMDEEQDPADEYGRNKNRDKDFRDRSPLRYNINQRSTSYNRNQPFMQRRNQFDRNFNVPTVTISRRTDPLSLDFMLSFKQFLETQNANISEEEAVKKYSEYKEKFIIVQAARFFDQHKDEEWLKERYHQDLIHTRKQEKWEHVRNSYEKFIVDYKSGKYDHITLDDGNVVDGDGDEIMMDDEEGAVPTKRSLTTTSSKPHNILFIKSVPANMTRAELIELCEKYGKVMDLCLSDPNPLKRYHRLGWVTYDDSANIESAFNALNNTIWNDFELHFAFHKEQEAKPRSAPESFSLEDRIRHDLRKNIGLAKAFDQDRGIECPVLEQMPKHLDIDSSSVTECCAWLDKLILYLRNVHLFCYYCANDYQNRDEMLHKCGSSHSRSKINSERVTQPALWERHVDTRVDNYIKKDLSDEEMKRLGVRDVEGESERFYQTNTVRVEEEKYRCAICEKLFKGPEFVRKHLYAKHEDKLNEAKDYVEYFNNYLRDPNRPMGAASAAQQPLVTISNNINFIPGNRSIGQQGSFDSGVSGFRSRGTFRARGRGRYHPYESRTAFVGSANMLEVNMENLPPADPRQLRTYVDLDAPPEEDSHLDYRNEGL